MSFKESPRFPECVSLGAIGGPGFLTDIVRVASGHEYRNQSRDKALGRWTVAHNVMREDEYGPLRSFFLAMRGMFHAFRFRDHSDFEVAAGEGVFVNTSGTLYQMYKRYSIAGEEYLRLIAKPVSGTVNVTWAGSPGSLSYTTGIADAAAASVPLSWTGEFDVPCRFGTDQMELETITPLKEGGYLIGWRAIPIFEVRDI